MGAQKIAALPQNLPAPHPIVNDRSLTNVLHAKKKGVVGAKLKERPVSQLSFTIKGGDHKGGIGDLLGLKELMILQNHSRY